MAKYDEKGREILDPTPAALPVHWKKPPSLHDQIRKFIKSEVHAQALGAMDLETFEEANDFDVGDDYDPQSPWEEQFHGQLDQEVRMEATHYEQDPSNRRSRRRRPPRQPKSEKRGDAMAIGSKSGQGNDDTGTA